ncbi:hypothetical protein TCAL_02402, partial [Tigriopus californicus]
IAVRGERKDVGQSLNKAILGGSSELRGWLYKRVHFFRGYRKHWFVLVNGTLSYYRKQTEESRKCRGSLFLRGSTISTSQNEVNFLVSNKHRTFDLRADSYNARCRWIKAIELAKTSLHLSHKGSTSFPSDTNLEDNVKGKGEVDSQELPVSIKKSWADTTAAAGLAASHNLALSTSTRSATSNSGTDDEFEDAMENPSLYDVLTKIPVPVNFSEPLSMIQRLTEDFEYSAHGERVDLGWIGSPGRATATVIVPAPPLLNISRRRRAVDPRGGPPPPVSPISPAARMASSKVLTGVPVGTPMDEEISGGPSETRGWLYKWTNYLKGYQKRWFVLVNGTLAYYHNQSEVSHMCRGSLPLRGSVISTANDGVNFMVSNGSGIKTFHLRAASVDERLRWVTAMELAKTSLHLRRKGSTSQLGDTDPEDNGEREGEVDTQELLKVIHTLNVKMKDLDTCSSLVEKHELSLHSMLNDLMSSLEKDSRGSVGGVRDDTLVDKAKACQERASLVKITAHTMTKASSEFNQVCQNRWRHWQLAFIKEHEQRLRLEEMVEQLAKQLSHLEASVKKSRADTTAAAGLAASHNLALSTSTRSATSRLGSGSQTSSEQTSRPSTPLKPKSCRQRRTRIPDKPDKPISLWNIVKNCIGKDLTKIPVPVNFSEPLSMIQRLTEDFEYSAILDRAATASDSCEQLAYVAAFTVSSYSTTAIRVGKPFNPLLGETFEYDRDDLGFRCVSEQVSHHPPIVAQFAESSNGLWRCWQEFSMRSKFKGKYLEVEPLGISHLVFENSGNHYSWRKVKTVVHNIVIGKLWVDQHGEMSVINHTNGDKCHMKFEPYSYFGGTPKKVTGTVITADDKVEWVLNGTWDSKLEGSKVISTTVVKGRSSLEIGPSRTLWKVNPIPPGAEKYYSFSPFACELNEMEEGVAPTDSRLRPDQRLMENGLFDEANSEKLRLEDKQRSVRREREEMAAQAAQRGESYEGYKPLWFKSEEDEYNGGKMTFVYNGGYWESKEKQDWGKCPDIF